MIEFEGLRERMTGLLVRRGITDRRILDAFRSVPREAFLPPRLAEFAYEDTPLPIGEGQTISQPYIVAITVDALGLRGGERVLEIGTGSGLRRRHPEPASPHEVFTVERLRVARRRGARAPRAPRLRQRPRAARRRHARLAGARALRRDRRRGGRPGRPATRCSSSSPSAAGWSCPSVPTRRCRCWSVSPATGRSDYRQEPIADVRFVPLVGEQGWPRGAGSPARRPRPDGDRPRLLGRSSARRPSRSTTSRPPPSTRCSSGSPTLAWSCSASRRTGRASSTGCGRAITKELIEPAGLHSSSPSRPTGPTRRASTTTCVGASDRARRSGSPRSRASPPGCGGTRRSHELRRVAARAQRGARCRRGQGRLPRARPLQPVHVHRGGPRLPRRGRSRRGARRARSATAR